MTANGTPICGSRSSAIRISRKECEPSSWSLAAPPSRRRLTATSVARPSRPRSSRRCGRRRRNQVFARAAAHVSMSATSTRHAVFGPTFAVIRVGRPPARTRIAPSRSSLIRMAFAPTDVTSVTRPISAGSAAPREGVFLRLGHTTSFLRTDPRGCDCGRAPDRSTVGHSRRFLAYVQRLGALAETSRIVATRGSFSGEMAPDSRRKGTLARMGQLWQS